MNNYPLVLVDDDGIRPAGKPDECFYCQQKVGTPHRSPCVCVTKKIKALYSFEIELEIPEFWGEAEFEFHRNESSWCADNAIGDLQEISRKADETESECMCSMFEAKFLEVVDPTPTAHKARVSGNLPTEVEEQSSTVQNLGHEGIGLLYGIPMFIPENTDKRLKDLIIKYLSKPRY